MIVPRFSLHPLNALEATPVELVRMAAELECSHVTIFTHVPEQARGLFPLLERKDVDVFLEALAETSVTVGNLEVFPLEDDGNYRHLVEGLEIGRAIGARRATTHIHAIDNHALAVDRFRRFCALAAEYDVVPGLEFNAFSAVKDIRTAAAIIRDAGCGTLVLDVLHLMRNGAYVDSVAENADLVSIVQLSDGPLEIDEGGIWREAIKERALPGQGAFPLTDILAPLSGEIIIEAEIPQYRAEKSGCSAFERARRAMEATRAVIADQRAT
ncbi:xylose isomerase [Sphingobium sp. SCG-1]|uniref:sugar phosphate isomerase/epimerase family protein n=1 Tax=Sphingobium sp. SCG-1 TaxID=2072936 RepID=UPI000CD6BE29|nr:TIM barrel protein [Sphingobium sp. SCG-1]AUW59554.1 xylose isomerase [Sphingobium sp. SCG-1]